MVYKILSFFLGFVLIILSACKKNETESDYFAHPDLLKARIEQCEKRNSSFDSSDPVCQKAYSTAMQLAEWMQDFVKDQAKFGQRILRAQIQAQSLKVQWKMAEKEHLFNADSLKKEFEQAQSHADNLRAVVAMFMQI